MTPRTTIRLLAVAALGGAMALALAGCGGNDTPPTSPPPPPPPPPPSTAPTPVAKCIVNADNDVVIGGTNAKPGCTNVVMNAAKVHTTSFDEISVAEGGTLTITGGAGSQNAVAAAAAASVSIPIGQLAIPMHEICIGNGGTVQIKKIGSENEPVTSKNKVVLEFIGKRNSDSTDKTCPADFHKGIEVMAGGSLLMYGAKGVPARGGVSWTTLAAPAGSNVPGAKVPSTGLKTLMLTADVTQFDKAKHGEPWEAGDWIVVATTSYTPFDSEFVQIASVTSGGAKGGSTVTLKQPLKYYHFGSLAPSPATSSCADPLQATLPSAPATQPAFLCDGADRNWGVDERAEVGLISRDIELTAQTEPVTTVPPPATSSVHWGGEIRILPGFKQVAIQGVRLSKFGKDQLGSYPFHFHMVGAIGKDQTALIDADSVDHSYNHCVTIHSTANLKISNLVCARILGHIFYEELMGANEDNMADDSGIVFDHDLGLGAMSNSFDIYPVIVGGKTITRDQLIKDYWWAGDYMTNAECAADFTCIHYDGFNIPDTDNTAQNSHGACYRPQNDGTGQWNLVDANPPPSGCPADQYYIEPASGFWIQHPGTVLVDNAIAGCQGDGVAYWWVPPPAPMKVNGKLVLLTSNPLGKVRDDRASACYHAYMAEGENNVTTGQLTPLQDGENYAPTNLPNIIAHFTGLTASHNRWRALWLRGTASPIVVKNGHFAGDNRGATLITSGGVDGNAPGVWHKITDSVFVGMSQNNVGRWGPCPKLKMLGDNTGFDFGCIDYSHPPNGTLAHSGEVGGKGYPGPDRNSYGYQIYDGPALMYHDRFVNYNYNQDPNAATVCSQSGTLAPTGCAFSIQLTDADRLALGVWATQNSTPYKRYEGDAALGWFPANQNAYPTATATRELLWVNTNLRHQIFTDHVNIDTFKDGDKNTAIVDEDGTLSGFGVKLAANDGTNAVHPISLNNLPFNSTANAVDECFSRGAQNASIENRDSSLMAPAAMGTLEFSNLWPWAPSTNPKDPPELHVWPGISTSHWQNMIFTRTDQVQGKNAMFRPSMTLDGRAGRGLWEPKVSNRYAYTVTVAPYVSNPPNPQNTGKSGIYKWIDVGVADVLDPNLSKTHPFYILLGINYATVDDSGKVTIPDNKFTIERGYKTYMGGVFYFGGTKFPANGKSSAGKSNDLFNYFTYWNNCRGVDGNRLGELDNKPNIPASNTNGKQQGPGCPAGGSDPHTSLGDAPPPVTTLGSVASFAALTNSNGTPKINKYYYNAQTGYLWLYIVQDEPNAAGPWPLGSCDKNFDGGTPDPACPWNEGESYYVCPKNGCIIYIIAMNDPNYQPGTSPSFAKLPPVNLPSAPTKQNTLVKHGTTTEIVPVVEYDNFDEPYHEPQGGQSCTVTQPQ